MSYNILYNDIFKREAKTLAKKYPSFKQDLTKLISELTKLISEHLLGITCSR